MRMITGMFFCLRNATNRSLVVLMLLFPFSSCTEKKSVLTEQDAISIATIKLTEMYGKENVEKEKPFHAKLDHDSIWIVTSNKPDNWIGGATIVTVRKSDGKIMNVMVYK